MTRHVVKLKPGFDPSRIRFGGPDDPVSNKCSICETVIGDDEGPLRMMSDTQFAVFCDACVKAHLMFVKEDQ